MVVTLKLLALDNIGTVCFGIHSCGSCELEKKRHTYHHRHDKQQYHAAAITDICIGLLMTIASS